MLVYYFVPFIVSNIYLLFWVSNGHNSVTVQNRTHVYMNFFDHKILGNHLLQLCSKVVKHPVYRNMLLQTLAGKRQNRITDLITIFKFFLVYFNLLVYRNCLSFGQEIRSETRTQKYGWLIYWGSGFTETSHFHIFRS